MTATFFVRNAREIPDVEKPACDYAFSRGWYETKLTSPSRRGFPDRFFARHGVIRLCEFKAPGETPTAQQAKRHRELRDAGVMVYVYDDLEAFKRDFV